MNPIDLPLTCRCRVPAGTPPWVHVIGCNARGYATKRHDGVAAAWERFVDMAGGDQLAPREFAPFGEGDQRRIDSLLSSVEDSFRTEITALVDDFNGASASVTV